MPITMRYDKELDRAWYKVTGPVTGQEVMTASLEYMRREPAVMTCDAICDLTDYTGTVSADEMSDVATATNPLQPKAARRARSAFITTDPGFANWARVLSHQFDGREFRVFDTVEAAESWLAQTTGDRPKN